MGMSDPKESEVSFIYSSRLELESLLDTGSSTGACM